METTPMDHIEPYNALHAGSGEHFLFCKKKPTERLSTCRRFWQGAGLFILTAGTLCCALRADCIRWRWREVLIGEKMRRAEETLLVMHQAPAAIPIRPLPRYHNYQMRGCDANSFS